MTTAAVASVVSPVAPAAQVVGPAAGLVGFLNAVVTNLLDPFLAPAPATGDPLTPMAWAVLAYVRRNFFNQAPTIAYDPTTTVQTGQTVTGTIGAADPEGDALTYMVTKGPKYGTLTIDQATGNFTYTPDDINYDAAQMDSFTVSVADGKFNLLSVFRPHSDTESIDTTVLNPTVERVILAMPDSITNPRGPRFAEGGNSVVFLGTPTAGGRAEVYEIGVDGTGLKCLTCGLAPEVTSNMAFAAPFKDGSGRVIVGASANPFDGPNAGGLKNYILEPDAETGPKLIPVLVPAGAATYVLDPVRFPQIAPDGVHIAFAQYALGARGNVAIYSSVGTLRRTATAYEIDDARVVYPVGEVKEFTPDGKGLVLNGGAFEAGNVDNIIVDLATGEVTRVTAGLDYKEDFAFSPNQQWIAVGSTRGDDALTPMTRIVRPAFLPSYVVGAVYTTYAVPVNLSNQVWVVALEDELKREDGVSLSLVNDGYASRSSITWNDDGDTVAIWEVSKTSPTDTRLVIAHLNNTTSTGSGPTETSTPDPTWAPKLSSYVPGAPPLPPTGTYAGAGGGTAVVSEQQDPANPAATLRTVTYTDYVNDEGMILNGTESTTAAGSLLSIRYLADVNVTGTHTGYLRADATIANLSSLTGYVTSELDGDVQTLLDPARLAEAQGNL